METVDLSEARVSIRENTRYNPKDCSHNIHRRESQLSQQTGKQATCNFILS
jgi:hypothetical protein